MFNLNKLASFTFLCIHFAGNCLFGAPAIPKRLDCYVGSSARVTVIMIAPNEYEGWINTGPFGEGSTFEYENVNLVVGNELTNPLLTYRGISTPEGKFEMRVKRAESGMYSGIYQGQIEWNHLNSPNVKKENLTFCRE